MHAMHRFAAGLVVAAMTSGCVGAPPPAPVIVSATPTASEQPIPKPTKKATRPPIPTPSREPTEEEIDELEAELVAACVGKPVPWAAPYAGTAHPLVVAQAGADTGEGIGIVPYFLEWQWPPDNEKWYASAWSEHLSGTSRIQLVICIDDEEPEAVGSCGDYTRTDGVTGEVVPYRMRLHIRVVVAKTGQGIQEKDFSGFKPPCQGRYEPGFADFDGDPPWSTFGGLPTQEEISEYAAAVSEQPVK
jgi:hypothetical protein